MTFKIMGYYRRILIKDKRLQFIPIDSFETFEELEVFTVNQVLAILEMLSEDFLEFVDHYTTLVKTSARTAAQKATRKISKMQFLTMFASLIVLSNVNQIYGQDISTAMDVNTLSELPIGKLLQVKNSFQIPSNDLESVMDDDDYDPINQIKNGPSFQALRGKLKPGNKRFWEEVQIKEEPKNKGMEKLFQNSITALAFLAFGGYMLCLVIQALYKSKAETVYLVNSSNPSMSSTMAPGTTTTRMMMMMLRRRRKNPSKQRTPKSKLTSKSNNRSKREIFDETFSSPQIVLDANPLAMFDSLISVSEAYARYHTIDYAKYNRTIRNGW